MGIFGNHSNLDEFNERYDSMSVGAKAYWALMTDNPEILDKLSSVIDLQTLLNVVKNKATSESTLEKISEKPEPAYFLNGNMVALTLAKQKHVSYRTLQKLVKSDDPKVVLQVLCNRKADKKLLTEATMSTTILNTWLKHYDFSHIFNNEESQMIKSLNSNFKGSMADLIELLSLVKAS